MTNDDPKTFSHFFRAQSLQHRAVVDYAKRYQVRGEQELLCRRIVRGSSRRGFASRFMQRQLTAFVGHPSRATYIAARSAVLGMSPLPIVATDFAELERLLSGGDNQQLLDRIDALPPSKVLSPRIHLLAAEAAEALGDVAAVELERSLFVLTLQGLLATGDGTRGNPYLVCHATDEYDVLEAWGLEPAGQSLVANQGRLLDVLLCTDGREVWFDITPDPIKPRRKQGKMRRRTPIRRLSRVGR